MHTGVYIPHHGGANPIREPSMPTWRTRSCPRAACQAPAGWGCRRAKHWPDGTVTYTRVKSVHPERRTPGAGRGDAA